MPIPYTLSPSKRANNQLARLWANANSAGRRAITRASHRIDLELCEDAHLKGTARPNVGVNVRSIDILPLRAYFEVSMPDMSVSILDFEQAP